MDRPEVQNCDLSAYDYAYQLLEEARKSWNYAVSNEVIYLLDTFEIAFDPLEGIAKDYLEGNLWISGYFSFWDDLVNRHAHYAAIFECCRPDKSLGELPFNMTAMHRDSSMLVDVAQQIKTPQKMLLNSNGVSSIVRLKRFDNGRCPGGHSVCLSRKSSRRVRVSPIKNWELSALGVSERQFSQTPYELVERRTQTVQNVSEDKGNMVRSIFDLIPDTIPTICKITLAEKLIRFRLVEDTQFFPKTVKMFLRPGCLQIGVSQSDAHAGDGNRCG